jgi:hypothetical protein
MSVGKNLAFGNGKPGQDVRWIVVGTVLLLLKSH